MVAQPLRVGALALACVLATATLVVLTVVASNLVLSAVAGLDRGTAPAPSSARDSVEAVRLRADQRPQPAACERKRDRDAVPRDQRRLGGKRCAEERNDPAPRRP